MRQDALLSIRALRLDAVGPRGAPIPLLKGVDLELARGQVLGLVGESGAGKSMLGLAAMGYVRRGCRIAGGQILFEGMDLVTASENAKRKLRGRSIAYVAQSAAASLNPAHRLIDQLVEVPLQHGARSRSEASAAAVELFRRLHLPYPETIGRRYPHQLSGGQLQRAMTAMALVCRPDLIIFDEPTTALDVTTQVEVLAAIKEAVRVSSTAAIFISHDLAVVAQMADRIMVLRHGEVVEEAETRSILSCPREAYTKSLWAVRLLAKEAAVEETPPILSITDVSAGYPGGAPILSNLSLVIRKARTTAVIGESGSGKSTLARVITGLLPPSTGSIELDGRPLPGGLADRQREQRRRIQLVSQSPDTAMNPRKKIADILGRPRQLYFKERRTVIAQKVRDVLDMVELPVACLGRYPHELSGGQKQRITIARALIADPDLIICDEVTSGLDQLVAESILKLLVRLQREKGIAYLFITHDFAAVNSIADEVTVMLRGEVVDHGTRAKIMSPPYHPYTGTLLSSVPELDPGWLDRRLAQQGGLDRSAVA